MTLDPRRRRFIIHGPDHAQAALAAAAEAGVPVVLVSAPWAAAAVGAPWFLAVVATARAAFPAVAAEAVLDCGDAPGLALAALRLGAGVVRLAPGPGQPAGGGHRRRAGGKAG